MNLGISESLIYTAIAFFLTACSSTSITQRPSVTLKAYEKCTEGRCEDVVQAFNSDGTIASASQIPDQVEVIVGLLVAENGSIRGTKVVRSCGHPSVDQLAVKIASRWKMKPAVVDGKPTEQWGNFGVTFKVTD